MTCRGSDRGGVVKIGVLALNDRHCVQRNCRAKRGAKGCLIAHGAGCCQAQFTGECDIVIGDCQREQAG